MQWYAIICVGDSDLNLIGLQDVAIGSYGKLPLHQSQDETPREPLKRLDTIGANDVGKIVLFRARLANSRQQGNKMLFCELRQGFVSIQGLLELNEAKEGRPLVRVICFDYAGVYSRHSHL